jgi:hypothetical protein
MHIKYTSSDLTFILLEIQDAGLGIIPLSSIKKGFRPVTLHDHLSSPKDSKIYVNIE